MEKSQTNKKPLINHDVLVQGEGLIPSLLFIAALLLTEDLHLLLRSKHHYMAHHPQKSSYISKK